MKKPVSRFVHLMKKYGPGFVALSKRSGRVVAHGRDIKTMWEQAEKKRSISRTSLLPTFQNTGR